MKNKLDWIVKRRHEIQVKYLELAQITWNSDLEASKKDSKVRLEYKKYRNEDRHLERMQQMIESLIEDAEWYEQTFIK
ncbi:hypothetical protein LZ906_017465 (plasmid) [Paraclostridium ghonii]|uniref:hypothetical protein n=1 Tax=Paraclostridium ghonii TaxID=29358 RepID=UPI00202D06B2|nr:hypothetical protein [Paeniclostridium ghonii]MCM0166552.1 hypothetical protein [Paeniclostridium ghonii]